MEPFVFNEWLFAWAFLYLFSLRSSYFLIWSGVAVFRDLMPHSFNLVLISCILEKKPNDLMNAEFYSYLQKNRQATPQLIWWI